MTYIKDCEQSAMTLAALLDLFGKRRPPLQKGEVAIIRLRFNTPIGASAFCQHLANQLLRIRRTKNYALTVMDSHDGCCVAINICDSHATAQMLYAGYKERIARDYPAAGDPTVSP